ncbi:hypothetical protein JYT31_02505 [Beggiatoa alba]|nr:hypothetical protein [Beggiatoa alba]
MGQYDFQLHYVTSDRDTRRSRVLERNSEKGKTYSLVVTPEVFDHMENFFEPPEGEELIEAKVIET